MKLEDLKIEDFMPDLEAKLGPIVDVKECCPRVYYVTVDKGERFYKEYYVLMEGAPFTGNLWNYGEWFKEYLYLFEIGRYGSGWEVMQYEITKYNLAAGKETVPEEVFHDRAVHAMDAYEEYFGEFPVPYHTPEGYTLRHHRLANGIYWLETSRGRELLALCFPIWNTELSDAAIALAKMTDQDRLAGASKSLCYAFFSKENSCVPIYELAIERPIWGKCYVNAPALMNALWKYAPEYAMHRNGGRPAMDAPQPDGKHIIGMFPDVGTDFLMLR
ncbi:MAG: hypothetical protein HDT14_10515 [Oscillibacter sp.]|nr:hypothetical protein [Oscillibacter sp.]